MSLHLDPAEAAHVHMDALTASVEREAAAAELLRTNFIDALTSGRAMEVMSTPAYRTQSCPLWELLHSVKEVGVALVRSLAAAQKAADPVIRLKTQAAILLLANDYADMHAAAVEVD